MGLGSGVSGLAGVETPPQEIRARETSERSVIRNIFTKLAHMDCGVKKRSSGVARHSGAFLKSG